MNNIRRPAHLAALGMPGGGPTPPFSCAERSPSPFRGGFWTVRARLLQLVSSPIFAVTATESKMTEGQTRRSDACTRARNGFGGTEASEAPAITGERSAGAEGPGLGCGFIGSLGHKSGAVGQHFVGWRERR